MMKKVVVLRTAVIASTALWLGCAAETAAPSAGKTGGQTANSTTSDTILVKLDVPNMT